MPKIVGRDDRHVKRKACRHCASINEYTENEVRVLYSGTDISGGADGAKGFSCANCGKDVITESW